MTQRLLTVLLTVGACAPGCSEFIDRVPADTGLGETGETPDAGPSPCIGKVCDDGDSCTENFCNPTSGACEFPALPAGVACDDGLFCTVGDTCGEGGCVGEARECAGDASACLVGSCDEKAGSCVDGPAPDGASCDDGDLCTTGETCGGGTCGGGVTTPCEQPAAPCHQSVCQPETGECAEDLLADAAPCDDGDNCTTGDACAAGVCAGAPVECQQPAGECLLGVCDPEDGGCKAVVADDGASCEDGDLCTVGDACNGGDCSGEPKDCSEGIGPCEVGVCVELTGACGTEPAPDDSDCDDGNPCTEGTYCESGGCGGGTVVSCADLDTACADAVCDPEGGGCTSVPVVDGVSCDDGDACTDGDECASGVCHGTPRDCAAETGPCQVSGCEGGVCVAQADPGLDGEPCDDGDFCTVEGLCEAGDCLGEPRDCSSAAGPCQVASCDSVTAACTVVAADNGDPCDDGSACTTGDICQGGACLGTGAMDCSELSGPCAVGKCQGDACVAVPLDDGLSCDDGLACTDDDACFEGGCVGTPALCSEPDTACATWECQEGAGGCVVVLVPAGATCDDGQECTVGDACQGGQCIPGTPTDCPCLSPSRAVTLTDGCLTLPAGPYLSKDSGFTLELWLQTTSTTPALLFDKRMTGATGEVDWMITYDLAGDAAQLRFHYGNVTGNDSKIGMTGVKLNDGLWHHVALVRENDTVQWWVDGVGLMTHNTANAVGFANGSELRVGCSALGGEAFDGRIDELRISSFARYESTFTAPSRHLLDGATVALWRFDDVPGSAAVLDVTGQHDGHSGGASFAEGVAPPVQSCCGDGVVDPGEACEPEMPGCTEACEADPPLSQAARFSPPDSCATVEGDALLVGGQAATLDFWIRTTQVGPARVFDRRDPGGGGFGVRLGGDGRLAFVAYAGPGVEVVHQTDAPVNDGQWHHLAAAITQSTTVRWYEDGALDTTVDLSPGAPLSGSVDLTIGCGPSGDLPFDGDLDGIRLFSGAPYGPGFVPDPSPQPTDAAILTLTFDHPLVGGKLIDSSAGHHPATAGPGLSLTDEAP